MDGFARKHLEELLEAQRKGAHGAGNVAGLRMELEWMGGKDVAICDLGFDVGVHFIHFWIRNDQKLCSYTIGIHPGLPVMSGMK